MIRKKHILIYLFPLFIISISGNAIGKSIFVDDSLPSGCASDNYSVNNRSCSGNDGLAYTTIQAAINAATKGDIISMRGGTYGITDHGTYLDGGYYIKIDPSIKDGTGWTPGNFTTLRSYPGEWAVIDGEYSVSNSYPGRAGIGFGHSTTSDGSDLKYWLFERFEVKNCQSADGTRGAAFGINGGPIKYRYLYIHDNYATNGGNNPSGIRMEHMRYTTVEYCWFYNNGVDTSGGTGYSKNGADITTITDYGQVDYTAANGFKETSSHMASRNNVIRYNLFTGGSHSVKYKGAQLLSGRDPFETEYNTEGDKVHHNIMQNYAYGLMIRQDFAQVYNNILDDGAWGIFLSYEEASIALHQISCYNNLVMDYEAADSITPHYGIARVYASDGGVSSAPFSIYGQDYNNILDDAVSTRDGSRSFSLGENTGRGATLDLSNYYNSKNYFYRPPNSDLFSFTVNSLSSAANFYTQAEFEMQTETASPRVVYSNNYDSENLLYEGTTGANKYITKGTHLIEAGVYISDGGVGGNHPYLSGVAIPFYIGATNPNDNAWVAGVLGLADVATLKNAPLGDPSWIENETKLEPPKRLRVID